jgi:pentapeptide MXKDX repeat protein
MRTRIGAGLALLALALLLPAAAMAQSQESSKDKMDHMAKDSTGHMAKDSAMMNDHMGKDAMAGDHMAKDGAMKDKMGKDKMGKDAMMKDGMAKDGMMKDHMDKEAMMASHGNFHAAAGHKVSGYFTLENEKGKQQIELSSDFSVEKARDLYLVLSPEENGAATGTVILGELKKTSGAQYFTIPKGTDLARFKYVVLWSKKGSVTIGSAQLGGSDAMMMHN